MNYVIKLINGDIIRITEAEYQALAGKTGLVFIPSCSQTVNMKSITHILDEAAYWKETRRDSIHGVLHDGTRVIRQFGQWVCEEGARDEHGRFDVYLDPHHYPEVLREAVASPQEWESVVKYLPLEERKTYLLGTGIPEHRLSSSNDFKRIGEIGSFKKD